MNIGYLTIFNLSHPLLVYPKYLNIYVNVNKLNIYVNIYLC